MKESMHRRCDSRCVNAVSLKCSCACEGRNHGTGKQIWVGKVALRRKRLVERAEESAAQLDLLKQEEV